MASRNEFPKTIFAALAQRTAPWQNECITLTSLPETCAPAVRHSRCCLPSEFYPLGYHDAVGDELRPPPDGHPIPKLAIVTRYYCKSRGCRKIAEKEKYPFGGLYHALATVFSFQSCCENWLGIGRVKRGLERTWSASCPRSSRDRARQWS